VSLKKSPPTWNEIEQLMDNPYQVSSGTACNDVEGAVPGNDQGYPTYCTPSLVNHCLARSKGRSYNIPPVCESLHKLRSRTVLTSQGTRKLSEFLGRGFLSNRL